MQKLYIRKCSYDTTYLKCADFPPNFVCGPNNIFFSDPMFKDTANNDYTLQPCSPLINAGNNLWAAGCREDSTGAIRVFPAGCAPYAYKWSDGNTDSLRTGLLPGTYVLTLTDGKGEVLIDTINILSSAPTVSISGDTLLCGTGTTGELTALPGGVLQTPVTFLWNTNDMDPTISGLTTGLYTVTLTDAIGCADLAQINLTVVDAPQTTSSVVNATHVDSLNGRINFDITQGVGPYTYGYVFDVGVTSGTVNPGSKMSGRVWPNPVKDILYLHVPAPELVAGIQLTDALGRLVYTGDQWVPIIHVAHTPEGVYYLVIRQSNGAVFSEKVVVQR